MGARHSSLSMEGSVCVPAHAKIIDEINYGSGL